MPLWPLVWAQVQVLKAWVRANYGKGTIFRWTITPWGVAFIIAIVHVPGEGAPPDLPVLAIRAARRIAALTNGDMVEPAGLAALRTFGPECSDCLPRLSGLYSDCPAEPFAPP
ncbi:MAG: hypothetical protein KDA53_13960 [Hyphomonas sp.]|nr:hypothetical protein [Hyphomonas sp.]